MIKLRQLYYAFPIRLLALHFRSHLVMVMVWVLLTLFMTGAIGRFFGMNYLLLLPEYHGRVDFWSFFITGLAFGSFFMIWNLTTYLLSADRFPFLATLQAPFTKYSLNNSLIPLAFLTTYLIATSWLEWHDELRSTLSIVRNAAGFLAGAAVFILSLAAYLHFTNKDIGAFLKHGSFRPKPGGRILAPGYRLPTMYEILRGATRWRVDTYLNERLRVRPVRSVAHYNQEMLGRVFRQNHFNAALVQVLAMVFLIVLGLFMDYDWARIPAGATIFILGSIAMSITGAVFFWFRHWSTLVFIFLLVMVNFSTGLGFLNYRNRAYGLDYTVEKRAVYTYPELDSMAGHANMDQDKAATLKILNNWLRKNQAAGVERPKMVFLCVNGGGMRSALWTLQTLQQADKETDGSLLRQSMLISGASGGMLGAGFLREIYLRQQMGEDISVHDSTYLDDMGKDLLNPVCFAIIANDLFYPLRTFRSGSFSYRKDRGYLFERQPERKLFGYAGQTLVGVQIPGTTIHHPDDDHVATRRERCPEDADQSARCFVFDEASRRWPVFPAPGSGRGRFSTAFCWAGSRQPGFFHRLAHECHLPHHFAQCLDAYPASH
ncbi:MAG: hypothetical protein IPL65_01110 [Lewinellaceae bacterium]|nr:hypothetical protein [Lewinellaceae bacterium]